MWKKSRTYPRTLVAVVLMMLGVLACATPVTVKEANARRDRARAFVAERAAFDMHCDPAQLRVSLLGESGPFHFGTQGCKQTCTHTVSCNEAGQCEALEANCREDAGVEPAAALNPAALNPAADAAGTSGESPAKAIPSGPAPTTDSAKAPQGS